MERGNAQGIGMRCDSTLSKRALSYKKGMRRHTRALLTGKTDIAKPSESPCEATILQRVKQSRKSHTKRNGAPYVRAVKGKPRLTYPSGRPVRVYVRGRLGVACVVTLRTGPAEAAPDGPRREGVTCPLVVGRAVLLRALCVCARARCVCMLLYVCIACTYVYVCAHACVCACVHMCACACVLEVTVMCVWRRACLTLSLIHI